jgi:hypothetical protein
MRGTTWQVATAAEDPIATDPHPNLAVAAAASQEAAAPPPMDLHTHMLSRSTQQHKPASLASRAGSGARRPPQTCGSFRSPPLEQQPCSPTWQSCLSGCQRSEAPAMHDVRIRSQTCSPHARAKPLGLSSSTSRAVWSPQPHRFAQTSPARSLGNQLPGCGRRGWLAFCCKQATTPDNQPRFIPRSGAARQPTSSSASGPRLRAGAKPQMTLKTVCVHVV